ncbi:protein LNK3-like isoform X1 [Herrania umbratica]|uniref:Protein LNK3-like isoform X1 n=1 Tax=Herrania umbratica TaxID=108875 RepID=A0A6J1BNT9_9ROSI|nr:protein LNK3-like isoform X1 [Herrania umbratica]
MDWYFGNGIEDLVVPKDQELADRLPSPESWSKWEYSAPRNFESSNKRFVVDENLTCEELKFNGRFCNGTEFETSADAKDPSSFPSVCGGLLEESFNQAPLSYPQPDYELDDFSRFQQMDDIFLSPLLEDLLGSEDLQKSFCFSPENHCGRMPADYLPTDVSLDSQSISKNDHGMGSTKYLKTHAFSPLMTLEKEISALRFKPRKSGLKNSPSVKAPHAKILAPPEQNSENGFVSEGISLEESVLLELEMVTAQLSNKTRICFRDAFYRLAKNSKQNPVAINQHGNVCVRTHSPMWIVSEEKMRSGRKETTESETNTIDRAIANLTFNMMETNVRDFPIATPAKSKQHAIRVTGQINNSSSQSGIHYFPQSSIASTDAEVPFLV